MESVIEMKASSILQFIHGFAGRAACDWEEGPGGLAVDLLQPQVQHIVVCNPRANALLKEGARATGGCAQLPTCYALGCCDRSTTGKRTTDATRVGAQLSDLSKDLTRVMNRLKALYRGWGIPVPHPGLCRAIGSMVEQDSTSRVAPASEIALSTTGWIAGFARHLRPEFFGRAARNIRRRNCCARFPASSDSSAR